MTLSLLIQLAPNTPPERYLNLQMFIELSETVILSDINRCVGVETPDAGMGHSEDSIAREEKTAGHSDAAC